MVPLRMRARIWRRTIWLWGLTVLLWGGVAGAKDQEPDAPPLELAIECDRLPADGRVELDARARLTVAGLYKAAPSRVVLACDASSAWIDWGTDPAVRLAVESSSLRGLVEDFLDALERQVRAEKTRAARRRELPPESDKPARVGRPQPARVFGPGGAGLRFLGEQADGSVSLLMGPRLDIGVGLSKHFTLVVMEGIRSAFDVGGAGGAVHLIDVKVGLAFGAPFDGSLFGVQLAGGNEWFYSSSNLVSAPALELGGRTSIYVGKLALWLAVDGMVRGRDLELLDSDVSMHSPSFLVSVGGFWRAVEPLREP